MSQIEVAVQAHFAEAASRPSAAQPQPSTAESVSSSSQPAVDTPFARVNSIVPNSPAADAGLEVGDQIARFGVATWLNHDKLSKVASIVSQHESVGFPYLR